MLIEKEILQKIKAGTITCQYRSWKRPTVKKGGALRTPVGILAIISVNEVDRDQLTDEKAQKAGYPDLKHLLESLREGKDRQLYRIRLEYDGPDPRKQLQQEDDLTTEELRSIAEKLEGIDQRSRSEPWTYDMLQVINKYPGGPAAELAPKLGVKKAWLKRQVRKLKELGLTISLSPGYRLSPRGKKVFEYLQNQN